MNEKDDITLFWLPSELPDATAEQLWNSLPDDALAGFFWLQAHEIARRHKRTAPLAPTPQDKKQWYDYLEYLESVGYPLADLKRNFFDSHQRGIDERARQKANAEAFIRYIEKNAFHIEKDVFDKYVNNISLEYIIDYAVTHSRRLKAKSGAAKKLKHDPKQADKTQVRECWELWQQEPTRYKWKTTFAKDMMDKYPSLESVAVITRWCKEWESEAS